MVSQMPIAIQCDSCDARFAVKDNLAGKKIRCIKCKTVVSVPTIQGSAAKPSASPQQTNTSATHTIAESARIARPAKQVPTEPAESQPLKARVVRPQQTSSAATRATSAPPRTSRPSTDIRQTDIRQTDKSGNQEPRKASIPSKAFDPPPRDFDAFHDKVLSSFESDRIERVPVEWSYRIGIGLVSIVMVALPLIYLAIIGLVAWGTYYHAVNHTSMMTAAAAAGTGRNQGKGVVFAFLAYAALIIMGIVMILFMLKPIFSRPSNNSGRRSLKPDDEPLLFDFVDQICDIVGAPQPKRIDIDCNINASAGFNRGIWSMFGHDLVLTIGMPLVAGLTMRQFAGVLAHEFGHFAQGTGMRVSYLIRSISYWFTRVVYERDSWDEKLENWSRSIDIRIGWIFYLTRLSVWLTRRILWLLMVTGHAVSGFLLRQMEYDADRHEARVAGSDIFASTARQLSVLGVAHQGALSDLGQFYDEGRLGDNLPKLIALNVEQIPAKLLKKLQDHEATAETSIFDTHPADRDRIASAARENSNGIFALPSPASHLFRRFDFHARAVTWDFYKEVFGEELKKESIHPVDQLVERQKIQNESFKALRRFFQGHFSWYRPMPSPVNVWDAPSMPKQFAKALPEHRQTMLTAAPEYAKAWKRYDKADSLLIEIKLAKALITAGVTVKRTDFSIPLTTRRQVSDAEESAGLRQGRMEPKLRAFEEAAADRLYTALQLARVPQIAQKLKANEYFDYDLDQLLQMFLHINERLGQLMEIRDGQIVLGKLLSILADGNENAAIFERIHNQMTELNDLIVDMHSSFQQTPYPFDHAKADISMAQYMLKTLPDHENPVEIYEAADTIGNSLPPLQARVLGRLCQFVEQVESALGMSVLEDPPEDDDDDGDDE